MQPHLRMRTWLEGVEALRRMYALVGAEDSTKLADINPMNIQGDAGGLAAGLGLD